jgi:hypothetical protein
VEWVPGQYVNAKGGWKRRGGLGKVGALLQCRNKSRLISLNQGLGTWISISSKALSQGPSSRRARVGKGSTRDGQTRDLGKDCNQAVPDHDVHYRFYIRWALLLEYQTM